MQHHLADRDPLWLSFSIGTIWYSLSLENLPVLWTVYSIYECKQSPGSAFSAGFYIDHLACHFSDECGMMRKTGTETLKAICADLGVSDALSLDRYSCIGKYFENRFGRELLYTLCRPGGFVYVQKRRVEEAVVEHMRPLFRCNEVEVRHICSSMSPVFLKQILAVRHFSRLLGVKIARNVPVSTIVASFFCERREEVGHASDDENRSYLGCLDPLRPQSSLKGLELGLEALTLEFGNEIVQRCVAVSVADGWAEADDSLPKWPSALSDDTTYDCLRDYFEHSKWGGLKPCAVCGRLKSVNEVGVIGGADFASLAKDILSFEHSSLPDRLRAWFDFDDPNVKWKVLDRQGMRAREGKVLINVCDECKRALSRGCKPKFSLANGLFRGELPLEFKDLTWIEEAVCSLIRPTAIVTRLYGSHDKQDPRMLRGNTCAHQMNVSSTVKVLPRTPADVCGMLSVVFIGNTSLADVHKRQLFRVRKLKVWRFLLWLKSNNILYDNIALDKSIMDLYPTEGLPGIENRIINVNLRADEIFEEETPGISEHPGSIRSVPSEHAVGKVFIEKTGVIDPDGSTIAGHDLHAAAVRNITKRLNGTPDLLFSNSGKPVGECDNPSFIPSMFPTLFPLGTGGLEDCGRTVPISLRAHADYLLDTTDRTFRYHYSFIFIFLNIWLHRMSHLHTYLVVSRMNIEKAADCVRDVSNESLLRLSVHLQDESAPKEFSAEDKGAFELMKLVNSVSTNVPGSSASKLKMRNTVLAFSAYFGCANIVFYREPVCAAFSHLSDHVW